MKNWESVRWEKIYKRHTPSTHLFLNRKTVSLPVWLTDTASLLERQCLTCHPWWMPADEHRDGSLQIFHNLLAGFWPMVQGQWRSHEHLRREWRHPIAFANLLWLSAIVVSIIHNGGEIDASFMFDLLWHDLCTHTEREQMIEHAIYPLKLWNNNTYARNWEPWEILTVSHQNDRGLGIIIIKHEMRNAKERYMKISEINCNFVTCRAFPVNQSPHSVFISDSLHFCGFAVKLHKMWNSHPNLCLFGFWLKSLYLTTSNISKFIIWTISYTCLKMLKISMDNLEISLLINYRLLFKFDLHGLMLFVFHCLPFFLSTILGNLIVKSSHYFCHRTFFTGELCLTCNEI